MHKKRLNEERGKTMQGKRVLGDKVDIKYSDVETFFDNRTSNMDIKHKYNYVLYQDQCPELAIERDRCEKDKIAPFLGNVEGKRVLDVGCGIGRWGEYLLKNGAYYVGVDFSAGMIKLAEENLSDYKNKSLLVGKAQDLNIILGENEETAVFDIVLVNGVFMYLNDEDLNRALKELRNMCSENSIAFFKESLGISQRLTLDNIHSDGLSQDYSAIYRSIDEYRDCILAIFGDILEINSEGELFNEELKNRRETTDYYFIMKK